MIGYRGYVSSRMFHGERVPQHVQNIVIRDYCNRKGLIYLLSATEYAMPDCYMMLEQVLNDIRQLKGIVLYSLLQLPSHRGYRKTIFERVLEHGQELHFSVESLSICEMGEIKRIEDILNVRTILPDTLFANSLAENL